MTSGPDPGLNEQMIDQIADRVAMSMPEKTACETLGISYATFKTWKHRGRKAIEKMHDGIEITDNENLYMKLVTKIRRAKASGEAQVAKPIIESARKHKDTADAKWILQTVYGWGSNDEEDNSSEDDESLDKSMRQIMEDDEARELAGELVDKMIEVEENESE